MREIALISLLTLFSLPTFGQDHLKFMDLEINGREDTLIQQLEEKGFSLTKTDTDNNGRTLAGLFKDRPVELRCLADASSQQVHFLTLTFDPSDSWEQIKALYEELKAQYAQQFQLVGELKSFEAPYREGDRKEMEALRKRKCVCLSNFKNEQGRILVMMTKFQRVVVTYLDEANTL